MADPKTVYVALTIAGSDSGGGAGIQADLKTFQRFGVYGTSALTLVTAQNTVGVRAVELLRAELITQQIAAVAEDFEVRAAKTGALGSAEIIETVAVAVVAHAIPNLVVDPVMISKHGDPLLDPGAVEVLKAQLFPRASLVTPNLHEAAVLLGRAVGSEEAMRDAARAACDLGAGAALVKGGHLPEERRSISSTTAPTSCASPLRGSRRPTPTGRAAPTRPPSRRSSRAARRSSRPSARPSASSPAPSPPHPASATATDR
jgi:hydroxymethylpyrimidine kinase/phosphomethylpyrimidine kinase